MIATASTQNLEDAANLAGEFIYSLDYLPHEVKHYLEEIKHKDFRVQELQQQIDVDSARWIKHSLRGSVTPLQEFSPSPSPSPSSKSTANIPYKIQLGYTEIEKLSNEKMALAEKITSLLARTRYRLESDINKVRILQGEAPATETISARGVSATPSLSGTSFHVTSQLHANDAAASLSESLRLALAPPPSAAEIRKSVITTASTRRQGRSTASPSIKLSAGGSRSISPAATAPTKATTSRSSRLSRQIHPPPPADDDIEMGDEDAEGEDDVDEADDGEDADDDKLYCFCQRSSYGDMIACDNEGNCPYEWFHLSCVGLSKPLPDKWYCSVCSIKMPVAVTTVTVGRKGRKK
ncbi:hypothetical protein F5877DRAFT_48780 [Lentinula edodes]|nr:hypothetical protein F5877DRAFT_48780 [Lentinula edodes]